MKVLRNLLLMLLLTGLAGLFYSCGNNAFKSIADDSSSEACRYEVTKNLDSGNYDAVLQSSCATPMDKGAAYFGKAGFDVKDVINRLSEAQDEQNPQDIYLKALVPKVDTSTLSYLDSAESSYKDVPPDSDDYRDAQFYLSLVSAMKGLSLMKVVIDTDGDGKLLTDCDANSNGVPDDVDATGCALMIAGQIYNNQPLDCSSLNGSGTVTFTWRPDDYQGSTFNLKDAQGNQLQGNYKGLIVYIAGSGPTIGCPVDDIYRKKLLYRDSTNNNYFWVTTTYSEICKDTSNNDDWPCPIEINGQPLDMVTAIDQAVQSMITAMDNALPWVSEDVVQSINEIRQEACGGDVCTSSEIADYLKNITTQ